MLLTKGNTYMSTDSLEGKVLAAYERLYTIAEQVRSAAAVTDTFRSLAKRLTAASATLSDEAVAIGEAVGVETKDIFALADTLSDYAAIIGPKSASTLWTDEEVKAELKGITSMIDLGWTDGILSEEQVAVVGGIASDLSKPDGLRGPRTEAPSIEGKPTKIMLTDVTGAAIGGGMRGNAAQSVTNLAAKLGTLFGVEDKKSDRYKVLVEYARQACNGDTVIVPAKDKDGADVSVTLTPVYETAE